MTKSNEKTEDLEEAIEILKKEYDKAKNKSYVSRPIVLALYQTWTHFTINYFDKRDHVIDKIAIEKEKAFKKEKRDDKI